MLANTADYFAFVLVKSEWISFVETNPAFSNIITPLQSYYVTTFFDSELLYLPNVLSWKPLLA